MGTKVSYMPVLVWKGAVQNIGTFRLVRTFCEKAGDYELVCEKLHGVDAFDHEIWIKEESMKALEMALLKIISDPGFFQD